MLDGPTSYYAWSQNMTVFLKSRKLWRYVTGSIPKPVPNPKSKAIAAEESSKTAVTIDDYEERLEEWESIQSKILSWFINTSIPSIHNLLPRLKIAEVAWKFLADCYNCTNDSSFIKCVKRQVSLFLIFILRLLLCGNNSLLQILH